MRLCRDWRLRIQGGQDTGSLYKRSLIVNPKILLFRYKALLKLKAKVPAGFIKSQTKCCFGIKTGESAAAKSDIGGAAARRRERATTRGDGGPRRSTEGRAHDGGQILDRADFPHAGGALRTVVRSPLHFHLHCLPR